MKGPQLTLSNLLGQVKETLDSRFREGSWVIAEILELHVNRSGHCYMELIEKDPGNDTILARCRGTIWASRYRMLRPYFETAAGSPLKSGLKILCRAGVSFHAQYGFSLNITDLDPAYTLGDLARRKQEVIRRLREEGVFDMNRELPFPELAQHIAVVSSETAAGYGDFKNSLVHNSPGFFFSQELFPARMQGEEAPASIIAALDRIYAADRDFDLVVLIRGGGSRADLECFNDYELAYYITQFPLPVLTGIGHDRDESVADLVAARSLKTPTAVAEFLIDKLLSFEFRLGGLQERLELLLRSLTTGHRARLDRLEAGLHLLVPAFFSGLKNKQDLLLERLQRSSKEGLRRNNDRLHLLETRTKLVHPDNILKRGYSMTLFQGKSISDPDQLPTGGRIETRLQKGVIYSIIDKTTRKK